ncbi:lipid II:glycine glycyltransferase (peptidoglycan interpeptide bridge formation enzyme) [Deinobacterium chartae]|uniref:Lipid II:glycine glycyltransferase (Peptidoglycan interpeptide bridge formation enzyme) n=1 Tax=Deinobacterium chartae TaxID=521158 RepID=A0A841I074_9DEIO|nr:lipid II:glycine glycyltransferase (peptidoglycan interpeptide bridge formation enzyme) [Deinobacterium chartae]
MNAITLEEVRESAAYDAVVREAPITSALQSWGFGEARAVIGYGVQRYLLRRGSAVVGAMQLLRKPLAPGVSLLYVPRGPVLYDAADLPEVAAAVRRVARPGDLSVKIEPPVPVPGDQEGEEPGTSQARIPQSIGPWQRAKTEQPEHTIAVDLRADEAQLMANLHHMFRRNVRGAQKAGVVAGREEGPQAFEDFWTIFEATNARSKLGRFPRAYYETLLREVPRHGGDAYIVLARHEGRALAGGFFVGLGKGTYYLYGGSIRDDRPAADGGERKDVKAPTAFYWNAMLDAKARGYEFFDLWGIPSRLDPEKHSFGVFQMKERLGGQKLWYPAYEVQLSPLAIPVKAALDARRKLLNYRKRGSTDDIL